MKKAIVSLLFLVANEAALAECTVPENLHNQNILAEVAGTYSPENPMSGQLFKMHFSKNGKYRYTILKDNTHFQGAYTYEMLAKNTGVITASENFNDIPVEYTMTMVCDNPHSGYYIYHQTRGGNGVRSNVARYFLLSGENKK